MNRRIVASVGVCSLINRGRHHPGSVDGFRSIVYGEAVVEVSQLIEQYNELVKTYQMITNEYNQMLWMAKMLLGSLTRFRAVATGWRARPRLATFPLKIQQSVSGQS